MQKAWLIVPALVGVLLAGTFFWRLTPGELPSPLQNSQTSQTHYPEVVLNNSETKQYNSLGLLQYQITAKEIRFFNSTQTGNPAWVEYDQPQLHLYKGNTEADVTVDAETGWSDSEGEHILLQTKVSITQKLDNGLESHFTTDELNIWPERQYASSNKPVIITQPEGTTQATGIKVWFEDKKIELLSDVRGHYAAP